MVDVGQVIGQDIVNLRDTNQNLGGGGVIDYFEVPFQTIGIETVNVRANRTTFLTGSSFIIGNAGSPGFAQDTGSDYAILGTNRLGSDTSEVDLRFLESRYIFEINDDLTTTDNKDTGSTTAAWTGTGSIVFSSGSTIAQSLNLGSDIQLSATKFDRVKLNVTGSILGSLIGEVTTTGSTFQSISFAVESTINAGSTGSVPLYRLTDSTGRAIVTSVEFITKQDDY